MTTKPPNEFPPFAGGILFAGVLCAAVADWEMAAYVWILGAVCYVIQRPRKDLT